MDTPKMFLTYNGTATEFSNAGKESQYENSIVFILGDSEGNGKAIYTHGQYFGDLEELNSALSNLVYFSKINVDGTEATASSAESTLVFSSSDPTTVQLNVDTTGITIGLTDEFVNNVATNTSDIEGIKEDIETLEGVDADFETRIGKLEEILQGSGEGSDTVAGQIASGIATANAYTDEKVGELAERVDDNESNIATILGDYLTSSDRTELEGAIETAKEEAIAAVLGENVDAKFDTLKEVADWILSDTTGAAALQTTVGQHTQDIEDIKDDIDTLETNLSNEITRSTEKDTELSDKLDELEQSINDNIGAVAEYTINNKKISENPVLEASDIQTTNHEDIDTAVNTLFGFWEWGEA